MLHTHKLIIGIGIGLMTGISFLIVKDNVMNADIIGTCAHEWCTSGDAVQIASNEDEWVEEESEEEETEWSDDEESTEEESDEESADEEESVNPCDESSDDESADDESSEEAEQEITE